MKYRITISRDFDSIAKAQLWRRKIQQDYTGLADYIHSDIEYIPRDMTLREWYRLSPTEQQRIITVRGKTNLK